MRNPPPKPANLIPREAVTLSMHPTRFLKTEDGRRVVLSLIFARVRRGKTSGNLWRSW